MSDYGPEHVADLRQRVDELLDRWSQTSDSLSTGRGRAFTVSRVKYVGAMSSHAYRLGRAVTVLVDNALDVEAVPTVRSLLEHAVAAQWVMAYGDDALDGLVNEEQRQRRNYVETMSKVEDVRERPEAQRMIATVSAEPTYPSTESDSPARRFYVMCGDLNIGEDIYLAYRDLSDVAHPSLGLAERYIIDHDEPVVGRAPRAERNPITRLYWTAVGLVWAARALDMLDGQHPDRDWLRDYARVLDIPDRLELSDAGVLRKQRDTTKRNMIKREQEWKGRPS